ncbi:MAG TPA: acyl-CoA dehydrogenase family protein [Planctomycetota bacterium]|nr:acyl-CoA dehydrogenase family protein [Planctomycetota bacterium]
MSAPRDEVRARAARFADEELAPFVGEWDRKGAMPRSIVTRLGELGFLAGPLPAAHGGSGWDNATFVGVYEELGRVCSSVRGFLAVHTGLVSQCLDDHGSPEQKRAWLPRLASGAAIGCYALTEEGAGSDVGAIATRAERRGGQDGDWVLSGSKTWITNGGIADLALVFAHTGPGEGRKGLSCFVVELPARGWTARPLAVHPLGHRAADHATIALDGVVVPERHRLGAIGGGNAVAMSALNHGRLGVAAGAVGIARACLDEAVRFARSREQFGHRIGDFQMVQADLADMAADTAAAAALVMQAAAAADRREPQLTLWTSMAKLFATEAAQRAADKALLLLGSRGYGDGHPVERHYRDIAGLRIYEGTNHIQRLIIARQLLGRP